MSSRLQEASRTRKRQEKVSFWPPVYTIEFYANSIDNKNWRHQSIETDKTTTTMRTKESIEISALWRKRHKILQAKSVYMMQAEFENSRITNLAILQTETNSASSIWKTCRNSVDRRSKRHFLCCSQIVPKSCKWGKRHDGQQTHISKEQRLSLKLLYICHYVSLALRKPRMPRRNITLHYNQNLIK